MNKILLFDEIGMFFFVWHTENIPLLKQKLSIEEQVAFYPNCQLSYCVYYLSESRGHGKK